MSAETSKKKNLKTPHTFHIPVMGTGYTADTPIKSAKWGLSSVISLVDDILIEQLHQHHCENNSESFEKVDRKNPEARAIRITNYLNMIDRTVKKDIEEIKAEDFVPDSNITKYFEMLPEGKIKDLYLKMVESSDEDRKELETQLRGFVIPGSIDVNIMTKIDRATDKKGEPRQKEHSDSMLALKGYAESSVDSTIVLSAGMSPKLYGYLPNFNDFFPDKTGYIKKKIALKVSDYRSAMTQARFLARNGLWVSEFRIEASLNCGGHAFPTEGNLLGPILEQFKNERNVIIETVKASYIKALSKKRGIELKSIPEQLVTAQGGIGTNSEDNFMLNHFKVDKTGWATPFLLVPEFSNVDSEHLTKLAHAKEEQVYMSDSSPLSVPFWMLKNSSSELLRLKKIDENNPGSPCKKGFLVTNTDFTKHELCTASKAYQKKRLAQIAESDMSDNEKKLAVENVIIKACICHDLGGGATRNAEIDIEATPTVCCGPNIVNFDKVATKEQMLDHIYGRESIYSFKDRPNMFIFEIILYLDALKKQIEEHNLGIMVRPAAYFERFTTNMAAGLEFYKSMVTHLPISEQKIFSEALSQKTASFEKLSEQTKQLKIPA